MGNSKTETKNIQRIPLKQILEPKIAMRSNINLAGLEDLKASILEYGLLQPIVLRTVGKKFEIIAGHRRFTAHKELKLPAIDAICVTAEEKDVLIMRLYENKQRENVSPYEESVYLHAMIETIGCKQKELSSLIGVSPAYLSERLKITAYPPQVLAALRAGDISFALAKIISNNWVNIKKTQFLELCIELGTSPACMRYIMKSDNFDIFTMSKLYFEQLSNYHQYDQLSVLDRMNEKTHIFGATKCIITIDNRTIGTQVLGYVRGRTYRIIDTN